MDKREFIKKGFLGSGMFVASLSGFRALANDIDELQPLEQMDANSLVGFNHLATTDSKFRDTMVYHPAATRGLADHGWLQSRHTFSFANYYNPDRMHFGVLRVLNDDIVAGGRGFGTHPHDNMEIISIPLSGDLKHRDSMGNEAVIRHGDVQVMSAGTGIRHSEMNYSSTQEVRFLQIWLFANKRNVSPRYDQLTLNPNDRKNKFQQILSPNASDAGVWIHQDAWFNLSDFDKGVSKTYTLNRKGNGVYVFVISGELMVNDVALNPRDGLGMWATQSLTIAAKTTAEFLIMEVPMQQA